MRVKRYVLDANIWFSYFISQQEKHLASIILEHRHKLNLNSKLCCWYPHARYQRCIRNNGASGLTNGKMQKLIDRVANL